jgi:ABC-type taurine transport system ATPase subunit
MEGLELRGVVVTGLLEPIDLSVRPGGIGAVVVGDRDTATRLADVVTGHARPRHGTVLVGGKPTAARGGPEPRPAVGLVPADGGLLPHMSVAANIRYGLQYGDGRSADLLTELVLDMARQLDVRDVLTDRPADLTPGRRLRVGLARALLRQPRAVVLEDRTGGPLWAGQLRNTEPLAGVAVLIVTDSALRVADLGDVHVHTAEGAVTGDA